MSTAKYARIPIDMLSEQACHLAQESLTKAGIWNEKLVQSGKYRGLKFCLTKENKSLVVQILQKSRETVEKLKNLKQSTTVVSE